MVSKNDTVWGSIPYSGMLKVFYNDQKSVTCFYYFKQKREKMRDGAYVHISYRCKTLKPG